MTNHNPNTIRFMPIGDSYTIGNGLRIEDRWPNLLINSLRTKGIGIELIENPAVSGYAADDALEKEIPKFEREKPDFGTLFIGTNDSFRKRNIDQFRKDYVELIDRMQNALTNRNHLVVIAIPKYADFPGLKGDDITDSEIEKYNRVIREEAGKRNLLIVDLYNIENLKDSNDFIADGIHPSAIGTKVWHNAIFPVVIESLKL